MLYAQPCVVGLLRSNLRKTLGIEGSLANDMVFSMLCTYCVIWQALNEIKERTGGEEPNRYGIRKGVEYDVDGIKDMLNQGSYYATPDGK